jgi:hypothetical protein
MAAQKTLTVNVIENLSLSATAKAPPIDVSRYENGSFQFIFTYTGGNNSAGNVRIDVSNENVPTSFSEYPNSSLNFLNTTASHIIEFTQFASRYYMPVITNTSGTGGTVRIIGHFITKPE